MGKWKKIDPNSRPHPVIEAMLQGPKVPRGFVCDGCTSSPDLHFVWACNVHDFESRMSSENWQALMEASNSGQEMVKIWVYREEDMGYKKTSLPLKRGFEIWYSQFEDMARRLRINIRILSRWDFRDGELVERSKWSPKRFMGYRLSRWYAKITQDVFTAWAE